MSQLNSLYRLTLAEVMVHDPTYTLPHITFFYLIIIKCLTKQET